MLVGGISCSSNDNLKKIPAPAFSKSAPPDQRRILSALYAIDPAKLDYQGWLTIGMALKSWDERKGLDVWHNWSAKDSERYEPGTIDDKWKSFGGSRNDKVTLGTLFHMAEEAGWSKFSFLFPEEPPPALEERIEEPDFPRDCLPPELVEYADDIAKEFGYETGSVTASMLTIASVLACDKWKVGIKPGWMEPLVLWLVKVAGSGEKKTPEFKAVIGPIENDLERRAKDFDDKSRTYKSRKRVVEKRSTQIQGDKSISIEEGRATLSVRPEKINLGNQAQGITFEGRVTNKNYMGGYTHYTLDVAGTELRASRRNASREGDTIPLGATVPVGFVAGSARVLAA